MPPDLPHRSPAQCLWLLAAACSMGAGVSEDPQGIRASTQPAPSKTSAIANPATSVRTGAAAPASTARSSEERRGFTAEVIHPRDAGLVEVQRIDTGERLRVRLIGLAAPAKATREEPGQEPWGTRGQQFLSLAITRKIVRIEPDVTPRDQEGQALWGYLWLGDQLINESVLAAGWATLDTRPPNVAHVERLQAAQRTARENGLGVWDPVQRLTESVADFRQRVKQEAAEKQKRLAELKLPAWQPECIIGNAKTLKFHAPGDKYYESAKRSPHAVFYRSAEDAQAAGLVRAVQ